MVDAGLDKAMSETRALTDGRRWLAALQLNEDLKGKGGYELFGGRKIVDKKDFDLTLGAWLGSSWDKWKDPAAGLRLEARF